LLFVGDLRDKQMKQDRKSFTVLEKKTRRQDPLTGFTHIKEVMDDIFKTSALPINFDDIGIWKLWDDVVGKTIARHARPSSIKKGVLLVKVTDSVWVQELEFKAETIKERLNTKLERDAIRKIKFRVGTPQDSKQIDKKRPQQGHDQGLTAEKRREMEEILARIKNKEIRASFRQIMTVAARKDNVR
jgi:hypothetical protein